MPTLLQDPPRRSQRNASSSSQRINHEPLFGDGERYVLPYRQLGDAKKYGWVAIGIGVFTTIFMIGWISGPLAIGIDLVMNGQPFGYLLVAFSFFGIFGLRMAALLWMGGLAVTKNRSRTVVEVRRGKLTAVEEFYWLKWRRKYKLKRVDQLKYKSKWEDTQHGDLPMDEIAGMLVATQEGKEPFRVAIAYPREVLVELGEFLATQFNAIHDTNELLRPNTIQDHKHQRVELVALGPDEVEPVEKPVNTDLELIQHDAGIKIDLPPAGFRNSTAGVFSVVWLSFSTLLFCAIFLSGDDEGSRLIPALFISIFELVGVGLFLWALNEGRRKTSIATAGNRLLIVSESLFGKKREEYTKDQIHEICVGDSLVSSNDDPVQELQVHNLQGEKFGCLIERSEEELKWIASELNAALKLEPAAARPVALAQVTRDAEGRAIPSSESSIVVDYGTNVTTIAVPPRGLKTFIGLTVNGLFGIVMGCGLGVLFARHEENLWGAIIPVAICGLFAVAGVGSILLSLVLARRAYEFRVDRNQLQVNRKGWLSSKSMQWGRHDIESVAVLDSGTKVNNRSLKLLKIKGTNQETFSGMTDHSLEDLSLVAIAINETLSLGDE